MEKVKVEICCGTACYLLGAANMMDLEDQLPAEWRGRVGANRGQQLVFLLSNFRQ